ncbi:MAG TPA: hypothetical protein VJT67_05335 [Longimicrobiaceae bacterium]|nr:hypothetical protein [Longimicrobiaceae bacterium]
MALATSCGVGRFGTFVYGSTQATEKNMGAACAEVAPLRAGVNANGLLERTFFYPAVMARLACDELTHPAGFLGRAMPAFREAIRTALGIGTGSCRRPGAPSGSLRGRIVVLERSFAASLRTPFAAVLTEHRYSRERRYQVLLPIIRGDGRVGDESVLEIRDRPWLAMFSEPTTRALLPVAVTQSAWYDDDVIGQTEYVLDDGTLAAVDDRLCALFDL